MRRFLAFVLYLGLGLPLAFSALLLISARPWALDREAYRRFVLDDRLYAVLQAPEIARGAPATIAIGPASFDGPALVAAVQKELPVPELKSTASRAVDIVFDAATKGSGKAPTIDLRQLKAALVARGPALERDYEAALALRSAGDAPASQASAAIGMAIDAMPSAVSLPSPRLRRGMEAPLGILSNGSSIALGGRSLSQALLNRMTAVTAAMSGLLILGLGALGGQGALLSIARAGRFLLFPSAIVLAAGVLLSIPGGLLLHGLLPQGLGGVLAGAPGARLHELFMATLGPIARDIFITGLVGTSLGGLLVQARRLEPLRLDEPRLERTKREELE
jgi:hypothetical protein